LVFKDELNGGFSTHYCVSNTYENFIKIIVSALILVGSFNLRADANPDLWPNIHERMFQDTEIVEADFIKIDGPKRAASGAQVPVNIKAYKNRRVFT
jgi:sulfur-oxidizing protein SoxY